MVDCEKSYPYQVIDLFDPVFDQVAKSKILKGVEVLADAHCPESEYALGTLLRYGHDLAGNPLDKDLSRAKPLIEAYAISGEILSFADLAELSLATNDAKDAMLWTQVYLYFVTRHGESVTAPFDRKGYNANLLLRATRAWEKARLHDQDIEPLLGAYLAQHKAEILVNLQSLRSGRSERSLPDAGAPPRLHVKSRPKNGVVAYLGDEQGYAVFLLEVQPSGVVTRIVAESFAPSPDIALKLKPMVVGISFERFIYDKAVIVRVPIEYGFDDGPTLKVSH